MLQNKTFASSDEALRCATGDVVLVQDPRTGLIFNEAFDRALIQYDADYQNEQALSEVFRRHLERVAGIVEKHFRHESLIEIGCGKAYFLEMLQARGHSITGFDPAYEGGNPAVRREYFTSELGSRAAGVILRHVLEHVPDPIDFLQRIRDANGGKGRIYIEVPCFDWISSHRSWFDIYYEHVNYFRLSDLKRMFGTIYEAGHLFGGQYLYAVADLATLKVPSQQGFDVAELPPDFLHAVSTNAERLMGGGNGARPPSAVWGAASKGVIFALFMKRAGAPVDFAIDVNPAKQGRFLPLTGLRINSPENAMTLLRNSGDVFVMNPNYLEEIKKISGRRFNYLTLEHDVP